MMNMDIGIHWKHFRVMELTEKYIIEVIPFQATVIIRILRSGFINLGVAVVVMITGTSMMFM